MRPYRFRMRLSSRRLNVTRFGTGPAAALRAAARTSLGSASSDIELMERLLSFKLHDCANCGPPQEAVTADLHAAECPRIPLRRKAACAIAAPARHGIV